MDKDNKRDLILERSLTGAVEKTINQFDKDGFDYFSDEATGVDRPKIRIRKKFNQGGLNELVDLKTQGSAIPGQSLTNDPDKPYAWETPPEFTKPHEAMDYILSTLLEPETIKNISQSLTAGASLIDITNVLLYSGFTRSSTQLVIESGKSGLVSLIFCVILQAAAARVCMDTMSP